MAPEIPSLASNGSDAKERGDCFGQTLLPFAVEFGTESQKGKKRPAAVLGETRPVDPDKGCVGEVLGTEYFLPEQLSTAKGRGGLCGHPVCV